MGPGRHVDFETAVHMAGAITPVPCGVALTSLAAAKHLAAGLSPLRQQPPPPLTELFVSALVTFLW